MSKILVHLYSYKERNLIEFIDVLRSKSSGSNEIKFYITDQNNLTRLKYFTGKDIFYSVVWWDELISPVLHEAKCVIDNAGNNYDYALLLKREIDVPDNWDTYLIENLPQNGILSGIGNFSVSVKNNFYINRLGVNTDTISNTSYVDQSLLFGKYEDILKTEWPMQLKYYGVDEYLSIDFLNRGIDIYSVPSNVFGYLSPSMDKKGYVPFSLHHNYNEVIDLITKNKVQKIKHQNPAKFIEKHKLNELTLYRLPFDFNDIEYNRSSEFDNTGGNRYINKLTVVS